jgi:unspecific monooxygenase
MHEAYDADRLGFLLDAVEAHGPVVEFAPGTVLVADPPAVHEVLKRTNTDFLMNRSRRKEKTASHRGEAELDSWMAARRAVLAAITGALLEEHLEWYDGQVAALLTEWRGRRAVHDPVADLTELSSRAFVQLCLGRDDPHLREAIGALQQALLPIVGSHTELPWPLTGLSPTRRRAARAERALTAALEATVAQAQAGGLVRGLRDADVPSGPLVRLLVSMSIASRIVPAAAVTWVLAGLTTAPRAVALDNVIDESLRLWPPTWMLFRETEREQGCAGWVLPAGCAVMVSPYVSHRDPGQFTRPLEYDAERWAGFKPAPGAYIPFGGGSRWCLGAHLAKAQLRVAASRVESDVTLVATSAPAHLDTRSTLVPGTFELDVFPRTKGSGGRFAPRGAQPGRNRAR